MTDVPRGTSVTEWLLCICYAMLCYAMLCYAMLCYAAACLLAAAVVYVSTELLQEHNVTDVPRGTSVTEWLLCICYAMLCYAVLCYAMLCYAAACLLAAAVV